MNAIRQCARLVLFAIRNGFRRPKYPFEDDVAEPRLKFCVGPWGRSEWYSPVDGSVYQTTDVSDPVEIAESMECDVYGCSSREITAELSARKFREELMKSLESKSPRAIGFWTNTPTSEQVDEAFFGKKPEDERS